MEVILYIYFSFSLSFVSRQIFRLCMIIVLFSLVCQKGGGGRGGGTAALFKTTLNSREMPLNSYLSFEIHAFAFFFFKSSPSILCVTVERQHQHSSSFNNG